MPQTVLVVDDDPLIVRMVQMAFELEGYTVITASDGEAGLVTARDARPDIVLLDVMMPKLDGLGVARALKDDPDTASIPIILVSAKSSDHDVRLGRAAGADDYVPKPFQIEVLIERAVALLPPTPSS